MGALCASHATEKRIHSGEELGNQNKELLIPVTSQAQFEKMAVLLKEGKITKKQHSEMTSGVNFKKLPKRIKPKGNSHGR